jgi:hypothetical protein
MAGLDAASELVPGGSAAAAAAYHPRMRLRIATCTPLPERDDDEDLLLAALRARGVDARMAAWNDPDERWDEPVPTVIRSTWDYVQSYGAFLAWLGRAAAAAPLWNPLEIVRANLRKRYLFDLEARGVAIVDTELVERGARTTLSSILAARGWDDVVVKPEIGAASHGARRFRAHELRDGEAHLARLAARGDALVQRYEPSVEGHGERAITWIDGEFTHAVRKSPRFDDGSERVSAAMAIEPDELDLAQRALAPVAPDLLYARVDVARGRDGRPRIMEVELVEPSLFLSHHPPALERLAAGLERRLR